MTRRHPFGDAVAGGYVGGSIAGKHIDQLGDRMGLPTVKQLKKARQDQGKESLARGLAWLIEKLSEDPKARYYFIPDDPGASDRKVWAKPDPRQARY